MCLLHKSESGVIYQERQGACPFKAGKIKSNMKNHLNPHKLAGAWINIFDRKTLNE